MIQQSKPQYWDSIVQDFDAIYTGKDRSSLGVALDRWLRKDIYDRVIESVRQINELGSDQKVLDVGCGTGRLCVPLIQAGHRVVGVDFSNSMLEQARCVLSELGIRGDQCQLIRGDVVNNWPGALDTHTHFDAIAMLGLLEYISDPIPMMRKLLQFSPKIMIGTFCRAGTIRSHLRKLRYKLHSLDCPLFFYTAEEVRAIADNVGARGCAVALMGELHYAVMTF